MNDTDTGTERDYALSTRQDEAKKRFGTPYSVAEARLVAKQPGVDVYIRELMNWLCDQIEKP